MTVRLFNIPDYFISINIRFVEPKIRRVLYQRYDPEFL